MGFGIEDEEEFEPLFDYSRVQPPNVVCLDDDCASPAFSPKRRKISANAVEKEKGVSEIIDCENKEEDEEDWLPPPPKVSSDRQKLGEDSTIKELRLKKQELVSFTQSAADVLRSVEESARKKFSTVQASMDNVADHSSKSSCERAKIIISIQDKDEQKQFRVYMDDKFERLFKLYADKAKVNVQSLVFCFDGDKIEPTATPNDFGMEDNDIIEVHIKSS